MKKKYERFDEKFKRLCAFILSIYLTHARLRSFGIGKLDPLNELILSDVATSHKSGEISLTFN